MMVRLRALVYGQMNERGARSRVALTGLFGEYFRDEEGQDVLFAVDNIFRFTQAVKCRRFLVIPSAVGYGELATDMGALQERITTTASSITSVQAIAFLPMTCGSRRRRSFAHLDATTDLSRQIAELGIYRPWTGLLVAHA